MDMTSLPQEQPASVNPVDIASPGAEGPPDEAMPGAAPEIPLSKRALNSSVLTAINYGGQMALRFAGNLLLTRLLFPKAFGLMALVQSFLIGLEMLSDVGITPSIVHSKRGDEPDYLNTAWTLQAVRGVILWGVACAIAYPAAWFYGEPELRGMLPALGIHAVLGGLSSTKLAVADRKLSIGRLTMIDLGSYAIGLGSTILLAWSMRSVWALVFGTYVQATLKLLASHFLLEGEHNKFRWDKSVLQEIGNYGRWILLSTAVGYMAIQGDRLVLGRLLSVKFLGVYTVALTLSQLPSEIIRQAAGKVLFPSYSEIMRTAPEKLYATLRKSRLLLLAAAWSGCFFLIVIGNWLIRFLYDDRYIEASWMLPVMAFGTLGHALILSYDGILLATGNTHWLALLLTIQTSIKFASIFVGYYLGGEHGVILGLATVTWLQYPADAWCLKRLGYWQPEIDVPLIGVGIASALAYFTFFYG
jgi:O-antigen/teichoic acid export membrane protein